MGRVGITGTRTRALALGLAIASLGLAAGCGGDDEPTTTSTTSTESEETGATGEAETGVDRFGFPVAAHVQPQLGTVPEGIELDDREGTPPPEGLGGGDLEASAEAAGCELQLDLPDEGNTHVANDEADIDYQTEPPTSGDHYAGNEAGSGALADGAYAETPLFTRAVHGLEHGRVQIQYASDLAEEDQLALKGLFDEDPPGMMIFPNDEMPYQVAVTAWTQLMGCESYDGEATLEAIADFRDEFRGNGPEPVPIEL